MIDVPESPSVGVIGSFDIRSGRIVAVSTGLHWPANRPANSNIAITQTNQILSKPGIVILITPDLVLSLHDDFLAHQQLLISFAESLAEGCETPIATVVG